MFGGGMSSGMGGGFGVGDRNNNIGYNGKGPVRATDLGLGGNGYSNQGY